MFLLTRASEKLDWYIDKIEPNETVNDDRWSIQLTHDHTLVVLDMVKNVGFELPMKTDEPVDYKPDGADVSYTFFLTESRAGVIGQLTNVLIDEIEEFTEEECEKWARRILEEHGL